jgi:predicted DNA-binding protein
MKKARLTVDMSSEEHMYLKMTCAKLGVTMKQFLMKAAFEKMTDLEDEWLAEKADEVLDKLKKGESKTIPWDEAKKNL